MKIRTLAEFLSGTGGPKRIKINDPEFGGTPDRRFMRSHFDRISKYVAHLDQQRWMKEPRYPQPSMQDTLLAGAQILRTLQQLMEPKSNLLAGDARHWYGVFTDRFTRMNLQQAAGANG